MIPLKTLVNDRGKNRTDLYINKADKKKQVNRGGGGLGIDGGYDGMTFDQELESIIRD